MAELLLGTMIGVGVSALISILLEMGREKICVHIKIFNSHKKLYDPVMTVLMSILVLFPLSFSVHKVQNKVAAEDMSNAMIIAQSYYDNGNYVEAAEIYIKWAEKSGVAAYNLAYMYSVGNGVPMCRTTSDKYYRISLGLGIPEAVTGLVFLHVNAPTSYIDVIMALKYGYELGDRDTRSFIARSIRHVLEQSFNENSETEWLAYRTESPDTLCKRFFALSYKEQCAILESNLILWKSEPIIIIDSKLPTSNLSRRYTYVSTEIQSSERNAFVQGKIVYTSFLVDFYEFVYLGCFKEQNIIRV